MKVRTQRIHQMGHSNRQWQSHQPRDLMERSFAKSKLMNLTQQSCSSSTTFHNSMLPSLNSQTGQHFELQNIRLDKQNPKLYQGPKINIERFPAALDYSTQLNKPIAQIKQTFDAKQIHIPKLRQLKNSFIKHNRTNRNMKEYFNKYATEGVITCTGLQQLVKDYGYDLNENEANLMIKLTSSKDSVLNLNRFIDLMTKENSFFDTLRLTAPPSGKTILFQPHILQILSNKYTQLKQAFNIYRTRKQSVDKNKFDSTLKKLDITDLIMTKAERDNLFSRFIDQNHQFNVQALLCSIAEQQHNNKFQSQQNNFAANLLVLQENKIKIDHPIPFKTLSSQQYEKHFAKASQVLGVIRKLHKKNELAKSLGSSEISRAQFRSKIQQILQSEGYNFSAQHYDSLSYFVDYNSEGKVNTTQLNHVLLNQSTEQAMDRFERRVRLPPHTQKIQQYDTQQALQALDKIKKACSNPEARRLFEILDIDKDGYLSRADLQNKISSFRILQPYQQQNLIRYLESQGTSANFAEFSQKIRNGGQEEMSLDLQKTNRSKSCRDWISTKKSVISAANNTDRLVPTKYSAWPSCLYTSDLSLMQPSKNSGQYQTEKDRFNVAAKHSYGQNQKSAQLKIYQAKLSRITAMQHQINDRRTQEQLQQQNKQLANIFAIRTAQQQYKINCHS